MLTRLAAQDTAEWAYDALIVFALKADADHPRPETLEPALWERFPGVSASALAAAPWLATHSGWLDCQGEPGELRVLHGPTDAAVKRVIVAGIGKARDPEAQPDAFPKRLREAAAVALRAARDYNCARVGLPHAALAPLGDILQTLYPTASLFPAWALEEIAYGAAMGLYAYRLHKTQLDKVLVTPEMDILTPLHQPSNEVEELQAALDRAAAAAAGCAFARDLVNGPSNHITPHAMAEVARDLAARYGFACEVLDAAACRELGMGAYAAVYQGNPEAARFIILEHAPEGHAEERPIVVVGKGVTFDTGGISLKPAASMAAMKSDMAGAAAVLGLFSALGELKAPRRVVGLVPCADNMPDGDAVKPGDVVTTLKGLTVEIVNTDAEGRLLLADALTYAERYEPAAIIDLATLTGACVVALGSHVAAVFTECAVLERAVRELGLVLGEPFWPLPLWDDYAEALKSEVADMKNVGSREGGAIHAAKFLERFIPKGVDWAHLDIAGPAHQDKAGALHPAGATGFGVRTLTHLTLRWRA